MANSFSSGTASIYGLLAYTGAIRCEPGYLRDKESRLYKFRILAACCICMDGVLGRINQPRGHDVYHGNGMERRAKDVYRWRRG